MLWSRKIYKLDCLTKNSSFIFPFKNKYLVFSYIDKHSKNQSYASMIEIEEIKISKELDYLK